MLHPRRGGVRISGSYRGWILRPYPYPDAHAHGNVHAGDRADERGVHPRLSRPHAHAVFRFHQHPLRRSAPDAGAKVSQTAEAKAATGSKGNAAWKTFEGFS